MNRIVENRYSTEYPPAKVGRNTYKIVYRVLSRKYHLSRNGVALGAFWHTDLALLAILRDISGFQGDEPPPRFAKKLAKLEQQFNIKFQGLPQDE